MSKVEWDPEDDREGFVGTHCPIVSKDGEVKRGIAYFNWLVYNACQGDKILMAKIYDYVNACGGRITRSQANQYRGKVIDLGKSSLFKQALLDWVFALVFGVTGRRLRRQDWWWDTYMVHSFPSWIDKELWPFRIGPYVFNGLDPLYLCGRGSELAGCTLPIDELEDLKDHLRACLMLGYRFDSVSFSFEYPH